MLRPALLLLLLLLPGLVLPTSLAGRVCLCEGVPRAIAGAASTAEVPPSCCRRHLTKAHSCCAPARDEEPAPCRCVLVPERPDQHPETEPGPALPTLDLFPLLTLHPRWLASGPELACPRPVRAVPGAPPPGAQRSLPLLA